MDGRLHEWPTRNDKRVTTVIPGHIHRAVFENLSLSGIHLQTIRFKTVDVDHLETKCDPRYYNTGL